MRDNNSGKLIVKGAMILSASTLLTKVISILYRVPLTDALGDVGNGIYSVAYQVYILLITVTSIGIPSAISKLVSERLAVGDYGQAHRVYKVAMAYTVALASLLSIVLWVGAEQAANFFNMPEAMWSIRALVPAVVIVTMMAVLKGYFQGMQAMMPTAVSQVVEQIVHAIVSVVLAYWLLQMGIEAAVVGSTLGVVAGVLVGLLILIGIYIIVRPKIKQRIKRSKLIYKESNMDLLKKVLITSIPIMLSASVFSIMTTIDYRMMSDFLPNTISRMRVLGTIDTLPVDQSLLSDTEGIVKSLLGIFSVKYTTILNLPVSLILTLGMTATPAVAASMAKKNYKDVRIKIRMVLKIGMLFAAPAAIGLMVFGKEVIQFLFAQQPYGGELLSAGAIAIIFITIAQLTAGILQGLGKQHIPTRNAVIACIVKVILNVILLQSTYVNVYAVVHTTTICYLVYAILNTVEMLKVVKMKLNIGYVVIAPIFVAIIMGLAAKLIYAGLMMIVPLTQVWLVVAIGCAALIYGVLGVLMGIIRDKDLQSIPGGSKLIPYIKKIRR